MSWLSRAFFVLVATVAVITVMSGTACTRRGKNNPLPPTPVPTGTYYVNPSTGNDSNNGGQTSPFKTLTKALAVVTSSKTPNLTIILDPGKYVGGTSGEKFPIVLPSGISGLTITGSNYGSGPNGGVFIDGLGEDTNLEALTGNANSKTLYTTLEANTGANVSISNIYVGAVTFNLPPTAKNYASLDVLGTLNASLSYFGVLGNQTGPKLNGVVLPAGTLACSSCTIKGNEYGIYTFGGGSSSGSSPAPGSPTLRLNLGSSSVSTIVTRGGTGILDDGTSNLTVSGTTFFGPYAYSDNVPSTAARLRGGRLRVNAGSGSGSGGSGSGSTSTGTVDFGGGANASSGQNGFVGATKSEIDVTQPGVSVYALADNWNPNVQGAAVNGQYLVPQTFTAGGPSSTGQNVFISTSATGSVVNVGPIPVPTPTASPTTSPSPSPTPT